MAAVWYVGGPLPCELGTGIVRPEWSGTLQQLALGLAHMRTRNLIHRDLKPQNLLLSSMAPTAILKIADFGFARYMQQQDLAETLCGSPLYMAPEILRFQKYDAKADLWSVGAILFEMLVGKPPFSGANHVQLLKNIDSKEPPALPQGVSAEVQEGIFSIIHALTAGCGEATQHVLDLARSPSRQDTCREGIVMTSAQSL